jgi:hypothetical protein
VGLRRKKKKSTAVAHQFSLYGYVRPSHKVPMEKAKVKKVRDLIKQMNGKDAVKTLREIREKLESHLSRIK